MTDTLRVALEALEARFKSGNDIPIRRAHITREEFDALLARLAPPAPGGDAVACRIGDYGTVDAIEMATVLLMDEGRKVAECYREEDARWIAGLINAAAPAPAVEREGVGGETRAILQWIMREADAAKEPCGSEPESAAAIRNGKLASIAQAAAQALGLVRGPSYTPPAEAHTAVEREAVGVGCTCHYLPARDCPHPPHRSYTPPAEAREPVGAVWLMPVATDAPQNPKLQRYAWGRSNLTDAQMAHAYDCIVSAAQDCGQVIAQPRATPRDSGDEEDAARYRWLRKQDAWTTAYGGVRWHMELRQAKSTESVPFIRSTYGQHLDAAIDAAMQSPTGEPT